MQCEGYKRDFKWRAFEETTLATKPILTPRTKKSKYSILQQTTWALQ